MAGFASILSYTKIKKQRLCHIWLDLMVGSLMGILYFEIIENTGQN
jgi:hypothetical protein